jgi:hypothetical protein
MKLAARMGRLNWRAMLAAMSREAFEEWLLSDELDGTVSGEERIAWTMAAVGSALLAAKGIDAHPADFVPGARSPDEPPRAQTAEEQIANCELIAAAANAAR